MLFYPKPRNTESISGIGYESGKTVIYTGGSGNVKGTWTALYNANHPEYSGIHVSLSGNYTDGVDRPFLVDIGIGPNSSAVDPIISNIYFRDCYQGLWSDVTTPGTNHVGYAMYFYFPVSIPKDTYVWTRCQSNNIGNLFVSAKFDTGHYDGQYGGGVGVWDTLGTDTSTTVCNSTPVPSNTQWTFGSWDEIIASTGYPYQALMVVPLVYSSQIGLGNYSDTYAGLQIGVGSAGSEKIIFDTHSNANGFGLHSIYIPCSIPIGTRLAARTNSGTANLASYQSGYIAVYGMRGA